MPAEKVSAGDPLAISARTWNALIDAKDDYQRRALGIARRPAPAISDTNRAKVKNGSGANRRSGEILELNDFLLAEIEDGFLWFNGVLPTAAEAGGFGVLIRPLPAGQIDDCQVAGICPALVNVTDSDHKYAKPVVSNAVLQSADSGPVRILHKPSGTGERGCVVRLEHQTREPFVFFTLTETLPQGGQAEALRGELIGGVLVPGAEPIVVVDSGAVWWGRLGYSGFAFKREDGKYEIVFMQRDDLVVAFHLNVDRDPGFPFMTGVLDYSFQPGNHLPPLTSGTLTIHDPLFLFPRALEGAQGCAVYNDRAGRYEAIACQQQCLAATAFIDDTGGMNGQIGYVPISGFQAATPSPFNQVPSPLPTQALNVYGHMGKDDDQVQLAWDEYSEEWLIIDVVKKRKNVIFDLRINQDQTQLEVKSAQCALEYNVDPTWDNKIPLKKCPTGSPTQ